MKLKSFALLAMSGMLAASFAPINPAYADDSSDMNGQPMQSLADNSQSNIGATTDTNPSNMVSSNDTNGSSDTNSANSNDSNNPDEGTPDTATGDDDY